MRKIILIIRSPTTFEEILKINSVPFFIPDFNLLSCELDNFTFIYIEQNKSVEHIHNTFTVRCEKS